MNAWTGTSTGVSSAGTVSAALSNPKRKKPGIFWREFKRFLIAPRKKKPRGPSRQPSWQVDEQPCGPSFPKSQFCVPGAWLSTMSCKGCRSAQEVQFNLRVASVLANHTHLVELGYPFDAWLVSLLFMTTKKQAETDAETQNWRSPKDLWPHSLAPYSMQHQVFCCAEALLPRQSSGFCSGLRCSSFTSLGAFEFEIEPQLSVHLQLVSCRLFTG